MGTNPDILGMTDEAFMQLSGPEAVAEATPETKTAEAPVAAPAQENTQGSAEEVTAEETETEETAAPESAAVVPGSAPPAASDESADDGDESAAAPEDKSSGNAADYEAFYRQIMAPFKANGKTIQLASAEEAIQLMQMGANYTKKMQGIQEHRKLLMMLEQNKLLDENKLSFLIDLDRKDPEAIRKLLKDGNIDPIDIDTSVASNYKGGQHAISDQEATLADTIDNLKSMDGGNDTLQSLAKWDQASKREVWAKPQMMLLIHSHRESGIYDRIVTEMDRQKTLGNLAHSTPFLEAYQQIGNALNAQGAFNHVAQPATSNPAAVPGRTPVAVRAQSSGTKVDNSKVRAAAPSRTAPRKAAPAINPFAMSDADFEKLLKAKS